jgi:hypothetical protein
MLKQDVGRLIARMAIEILICAVQVIELQGRAVLESRELRLSLLFH